MRTLLVCRHAKALKDPEMSDLERPLLPEGFDAMREIAQRIVESDLVPEVIFSSQAVRAVETMNVFITVSGFSGKKEIKRELYGAEPATYIDVLNRAPDDVGTLMIVGHNPEIEEFVRKMTGKGIDMKAADIAVLRCPVEHWYDLSLEPVCELANVFTAYKRL